ncbi:HSPB1-associated protein 1 homolog [Coregonus clupeaformis]|uniref:HSPB1-associated protein 1 homolog n=1 Tax=Coregonus clupeaformis TaxID=59861 RepID=UPI001BE110A1|nr:HSPB1-associated protein 1 homolog [Coregonus clupeaformis]
MTPKPFSPEEIQRILGSLQRPAVFLNITCDWPVLLWTVDHLSRCLGGKAVRFRMGRRQHEKKTPLFETQCSYVEARLEEFQSWTEGQTGAEDVGCFSNYPLSLYWAYADYKYIALLLQEKPSMFEDVVWSQFGFPGRNGRDSTLWIGTEGANTPCHLDSYGYNLVLQVQGRKRWHLFPPADTGCLYPSRIPYEESSVFSQVDVLQPDLQRFPAFRHARAYTVTLQPGQVLFVPRHWWHYVESIDPVTVSVNSWIELEVDDEARVGEALTKAIVCALKTTPSDDNDDDWLNPTEVGLVGHDENMQYLNLAVGACMEKRGTTSHRDQQTQDTPACPGAKRDSRGQAKNTSSSSRPAEGSSSSSSSSSTPSTVPFGPHLIPVTWNQITKQETTEQNPKDQDGPSPSRDCDIIRPSSVTQSTPLKPVSGSRAQHQHGGEGISSSRSASDPQVLPQPGCRDRGRPSPWDRDQGEGDRAHCLVSITTNDLLQCLVHPEVIARVTELLMERQSQVRHSHSHNTIAS